MSYKQGAVTGYLDFLSLLLKHLVQVSPATLSIAGGGNSSGTMTQPTADAGVKQQTWTAVCETGGGDATAKFDVSGSVAGANSGQATAGSAYDENVQFTISANGGTFVVGDTFTFTTGSWTILESRATGVSLPVNDAENTGDGSSSQPTSDADSTPQRWTLECTTGGGDSVAEFSVTGSFSGAKSAATSGSAYDDEVQFTISAGAADWVIGDKIVFWVDGEVYLRGDGAATTQKPHVSIKTSHSVGSDRYNWTLQGAIAHDDLLEFDEQLGAIPISQGQPCLLLWNSAITATVSANDSRFIAIAAAAGQPVESCCCGFFQPFGPPETYPYPLIIGGCHYDPTKIATVQESAHTWWARDTSSTAGAKSSGHVLTPGNTWARLRSFVLATLDNNEQNYFIAPTGLVSSAHKVAQMPDGSYWKRECLIVIHGTAAGDDTGTSAGGDKAPAGYMPGLYWVTGFGLTTGHTLGDSPEHYVFQNTYRNDVADFQAVALEP